jgi:hypothetical protein
MEAFGAYGLIHLRLRIFLYLFFHDFLKINVPTKFDKTIPPLAFEMSVGTAVNRTRPPLPFEMSVGTAVNRHRQT